MVALPFLPSSASTAEVQLNDKEIPFGDGFVDVTEQVNPTREVWSLTFGPLNQADATTLKGFFKTNRGKTLVDWTPPGEASPMKFRMFGALRISYSGVAVTVAFSMKQEYRNV